DYVPMPSQQRCRYRPGSAVGSRDLGLPQSARISLSARSVVSVSHISAGASGGKALMAGKVRNVIAAGGLLMAAAAAGPAEAQKSGGILRLSHFDSPASMSILEESTRAAEQPMMHVFNNLVMYKQDVAQTSLQSIVPDLATGWSWNEEGTELTFPLRQGVKWHDGKPFTAQDVKCTWDLLMDRASEKLRVNPRKSAFANVDQVSTNGDYEVTFHLKRPQPAFLMLIANDFSEIYPCHVSPREMRQHST